jgi:flavocytochrome c
VNVLVVGSGVAGLGAAVEAAEAGAEVLVLERGVAVGGASVMSAASTSMVGTSLQTAHGIDDDVELALADWIRMGGPTADVEWARRYLERSRKDIYEWCADLGIKWMALSQPEGNSVPRVHTPAGFGRGIVDALIVRAESLGVRIEVGVDVKQIVMHDGVARGVRAATTDGEERQFDARAVIACAGGFASSHDLTIEVAPQLRELPRVLSGGAPGALTYGYHLLHDAGAQFTCLDHVWAYPNGTPDPDDESGIRGVGVLGLKGDIWLNSNGRRFVDEGNQNRVSSMRALLAQPDQTAWSIFNAAELSGVALVGNDHWGGPGGGDPAVMAEFWRRSEFVWRAGTLEELATRTGLPADAVEASVSNFNSAVLAGKDRDPEQERSLSGVLPISGPDLIAIQFFPVVAKTLGGVRTDLECRVLDQNGAVIPGLFAAGELAGMAGGCINGSAALEGTMFGPCLYSGRVAGAAAVAARTT